MPFKNQKKKSRFSCWDLCPFEVQIVAKNIFPIFISFANYVRLSCSLFILNIALNNDLIEITISRKYISQFLWFLKNHTLTEYTMLIEYTAIDFPGKKLRFELVVLLLSMRLNSRIKLRWFTNEVIAVTTLSHLYKIAFWLEREIRDMFGILFQFHGDLRRILTDYGFLGHPLRKDFPLTGYSEVHFDEFTRNIIAAPVSLAQEYRYYEFINPWTAI